MLASQRRLLLMGLACAAVLVFSLPATAAITVSVVSGASTIDLDGPNDPLILTLEIANPDQLAIKSWSLDLTYDPGIFDPILGIGTVPTQGFELGTYIPSVSSVYNPTYEHNGIAPDKERMGVTNYAGTSGNATSGTLAKVAFDAIGMGNNTFSISSGTIILSDGSVASGVIYNPVTVTVTPEPGCMGLLLLGAMGLIRRRA